MATLQKTAKKVAEEAALPEDPQEGQEDNNMSNLSDEESSDEEPELTGNIWGPIWRILVFKPVITQGAVKTPLTTLLSLL